MDAAVSIRGQDATSTSTSSASASAIGRATRARAGVARQLAEEGGRRECSGLAVYIPRDYRQSG